MALGEQAGPSPVSIAVAAAVPAVLAAVYGILRRRFANANEAVQAVFTLAVAAMAALTVIGVFFRGEGMRWVWWTMP
jgi:hypothetical protein